MGVIRFSVFSKNFDFKKCPETLKYLNGFEKLAKFSYFSL